MSITHHTIPKQNILTVRLEDYFHVGTFTGIIQREQWERLDPRLELNTLKVLALLDQFCVKATFFVSGWVAEQEPDVVREVARRGHEIACSGYDHRSIRQMTPAEFRDDLMRSREAVERASGTKVLGYRTAHKWGTGAELWALDVLAEEGFAYDSSMSTVFRSFGSEPWRGFAYRHQSVAGKQLWEIPISTCNVFGWQIPVAGGGYLRQLPRPLMRMAVKHWRRTYDAPLVMYFHTWDIDSDQPRINAASRLARIRRYRNLDRMSAVLEEYLKAYNFISVAEYLGLNTARDFTNQSAIEMDANGLQSGPQTALPITVAKEPQDLTVGKRPPCRPTAVSIVVPCFNEQLTLGYLSNTLKSVVTALASRYELKFIFVDDGSTDETWNSLRLIFGSWVNCHFVRHARNRGVAAAIMTGINCAMTEVVCSIDCDCTYDPHELGNMIPLLTTGVDMVTASPYHPQGMVRNVPSWRLALSKTSSFLYRRVLRQKLFTYTSCFRVYRRSALVNLQLEEDGFLGIAEMLGKLDFQGSRIVEHPATLDVRLFGQSKMKVMKTIIRHLYLLTRLLAMRSWQGRVLDRVPAQEVLRGNEAEFEYKSLRAAGKEHI